jgi:hypothetical protein
MVTLRRKNTKNELFTATRPEKHGVYRNNRTESENGKTVLTLSELEEPVFGQWYDEIESELILYSETSGSFHIRAYLLDKNEEVIVTINLSDSRGPLYSETHKLDGHKGINFTDSFQAECEIDCATLALDITAEYYSSGSKQYVSRRVTAVKGAVSLMGAADDAPEAVSISVDHPTKRAF